VANNVEVKRTFFYFTGKFFFSLTYTCKELFEGIVWCSANRKGPEFDP